MFCLPAQEHKLPLLWKHMTPSSPPQQIEFINLTSPYSFKWPLGFCQPVSHRTSSIMQSLPFKMGSGLVLSSSIMCLCPCEILKKSFLIPSDSGYLPLCPLNIWTTFVYTEFCTCAIFGLFSSKKFSCHWEKRCLSFLISNLYKSLLQTIISTWVIDFS